MRDHEQRGFQEQKQQREGERKGKEQVAIRCCCRLGHQQQQPAQQHRLHRDADRCQQQANRQGRWRQEAIRPQGLPEQRGGFANRRRLLGRRRGGGGNGRRRWVQCIDGRGQLAPQDPHDDCAAHEQLFIVWC